MQRPVGIGHLAAWRMSAADGLQYLQAVACPTAAPLQANTQASPPRLGTQPGAGLLTHVALKTLHLLHRRFLKASVVRVPY